MQHQHHGICPNWTLDIEAKPMRQSALEGCVSARRCSKGSSSSLAAPRLAAPRVAACSPAKLSSKAKSLRICPALHCPSTCNTPATSQASQVIHRIYSTSQHTSAAAPKKQEAQLWTDTFGRGTASCLCCLRNIIPRALWRIKRSKAHCHIRTRYGPSIQQQVIDSPVHWPLD